MSFVEYTVNFMGLFNNLPHCKAVLSLSFKKIKKIVEKGLTSVKVCDRILSVVTAQQNREKTREKKLKKF